MHYSTSYGVIEHKFEMNKVTSEQEERRISLEKRPQKMFVDYLQIPLETNPSFLFNSSIDTFAYADGFNQVIRVYNKTQYAKQVEESLARLSERISTIIKAKKQNNNYVASITRVRGSASVLSSTIHLNSRTCYWGEHIVDIPFYFSADGLCPLVFPLIRIRGLHGIVVIFV